MSKNVQLERQSPKVHRDLQIIVNKIKTGDTNSTIAKRFGVAYKTVQRALEWGRDQGFFEIDTRERLYHYLVEFNRQLEWIREERELAVNMTKNKHGKRTIPIHPRHFAALSREERDTLTKMLELEGLYKNAVNVPPAPGDEEEEEEVITGRWVIVDPDEEP